MKSGRIFLVGQTDSKLVPMDETFFDTEDKLQELLASYPDLLPGDQITPENPRRWLLVSREMGVPGDINESDRWSLDHLFLDQDGVPTFVECKRASDTRGRREVVAQMLDYAANGIAYWGMNRLRQAAAETAQRRGQQIDAEVRVLLDTEDDAEIQKYWGTVETNLREGKIRLIFVADSLPKELRRLVEFLNGRMRDVEVLGVEVKQFLGSDQKALVPRVIGLTEAARDFKPTAGAKSKTTRAEFLAKCTPPAVPAFERLLDRATARGHTIYWGEVGFSVRVRVARRLTSFVYGYPADKFEIYLGYLPLPDAEVRELRARLLAFGLFQEFGEKTLRIFLRGDAPAQIDPVYDFILERMHEMGQIT